MKAVTKDLYCVDGSLISTEEERNRSALNTIIFLSRITLPSIEILFTVTLRMSNAMLKLYSAFVLDTLNLFTQLNSMKFNLITLGETQVILFMKDSYASVAILFKPRDIYGR